MVLIRIEYIISLCLAVFFYIYLIISQFIQPKPIAHQIVKDALNETEETPIDTETRLDEIEETLDDFFKEQDMISIREQLADVENITSEPIFEEPEPFAISQDEDLLISEGERLYSEFNEELFDSAPRTISEQQEDLQHLMSTIESLESLDSSHYQAEVEKTVDMGTGLFYDSISQKLSKIIKEHDFKKTPFLQAEKLEAYAFQSVKNITHTDFRETLKIMKEIYVIKEIVQINEITTLLNFHKTPLFLDLPEKVVLFFMANNFPTTIAKLLEFTQWKPNYLNQVLEGLQAKDYITRTDDEVSAEGLNTPKEFEELRLQMEEINNKKRKKEEEAKLLAEEKKILDEKSRLKKKEDDALKLRERQEKLLKDARNKARKEAEKAREKAEKLTKEEEIERLKKIKSMPKPKIAILPKKPEIEEPQPIKSKKKSKKKSTKKSEFAPSIKIIQKILTDFREHTGGMIVTQALEYYSKEAGLDDETLQKLPQIIQEMKKLNIINLEIEHSGVSAYVYTELEISPEMRKMIELFIIHGEMSYAEMEAALGWKITEIEPIIKHFYEEKLIKYNQREKFYFPGLFNIQ
ncbi:MAG: hypothetical protein ACTSYI_14105 [Promethearchaeota archaeon]